MLRQLRFYCIMLPIVLLTLLFSLSQGSAGFSWLPLSVQQTDATHLMLFKLRLARTITAFVSGGLLALSGALMQLLLHNPLADPYVLGLSSGAALVTLLLMLLGVNAYGLIAGSWIGSLVTMLLILLLARRHRFQTHALLLIGIALACGFSACISFVLTISPAAELHSMLFWLMGDLNDTELHWMPIVILFVGLASCYTFASGLNILSRGEKEAQALGLASQKYRILLFVFSSLFTATAVTMVGCIGFIGLIVPHLTRILFGYDHRILLPLAVLLGGSMLTLADTLARSLIAPEQLPVGIFMALIGVPLFIWLVQK